MVLREYCSYTISLKRRGKAKKGTFSVLYSREKKSMHPKHGSGKRTDMKLVENAYNSSGSRT